MANDFLSQSSAMEQIGDNPVLPEDIIRTILKRLPVKSLIRFQCVCKDWKNLLKTPSFITEHLHHSRNENPLLLLQWYDKFHPLHFHTLNHKMQNIEVQPPFSSSWTQIVGCSNGLLCVKYNDFETSIPSLLVWNPATREISHVPSSIKIDLDIDFCPLGFGSSPIDNDYKILVSHNRDDIDSLSNPLQVYSLSTGSWKEIKVEDFGGLRIPDDSPVTTDNGAMFWFGEKVMNMDKNYDCIVDRVIVSFDMAMEVFTLIPLPCDDDDDDDDLCESFLTVYENKLAMLSDLWVNNESCRTDLWVMEERARSSGWSWSKKYSISISSSIYPRGIWFDKIVYLTVGFPRYDEPVDETDDTTIDVLHMLNLSPHEWLHFNCRQRGSHLYLTFNYVESLTPVANILP